MSEAAEQTLQETIQQIQDYLKTEWPEKWGKDEDARPHYIIACAELLVGVMRETNATHFEQSIEMAEGDSWKITIEKSED